MPKAPATQARSVTPAKPTKPRTPVTKKKTLKAQAEGAPPQAALRNPLPGMPRICFERIVPDALDPEQHVRRALRNEMAAAAGRRLKAEEVLAVARMAVVRTKQWPRGTVLRCRFLDGSAKMQTKVRTLAKAWEQHANVRLSFVAQGAAEIRISFYADSGSWSAVGRDALNTTYFPSHQPTMNFGWVRDNSNAVEDRAVVLHEFGHALGCIHEHQSPTFSRRWNTAAVMQYFQGPPNFWDAAQIERNVLRKYSPQGVRATTFDPASIMLYAFDAELFADGEGPTNNNSDLSRTDRAMIRKMYPV